MNQTRPDQTKTPYVEALKVCKKAVIAKHTSAPTPSDVYSELPFKAFPCCVLTACRKETKWPNFQPIALLRAATTGVCEKHSSRE